MKLVINAMHGGFGLSNAAMAYCNYTPKSEFDYYNDIPRNDSRLVEFITRYGSEAASAAHANLVIIEIPDDVDWTIEEYDGYEHVAERHRVWYASLQITNIR
jgi:hypothetical protein